MADKKFSTKRFGDTYYPITQNQMSNNRFKNFTGDKEFGSREDLNKYHKKLKEKLYKENVRPSEIAKLDKEFKARMKRANDDLQYKLSNRAGMKEERRKQKGTIPDTGSAFSIGGEMLKGKQKKLDKNKDGKISGEDFKMMKAKYGKMTKKPEGAVLGVLALGAAGALGGKKLLSKKKEIASVSPSAKAASSATPMRSKLLQKAMDDGILKKAKYGKMMKAKKGGGADMGKKDYKLGLEIQGDYKGKDLKGKAKEFVNTAVKQTKGTVSGIFKKKKNK